jgi:hypothetical protein
LKKKIKIRSLKTIANNHTVYGTRYKAKGKRIKALDCGIRIVDCGI